MRASGECVGKTAPRFENNGGSIRIADSMTFPGAKTVAAALTVIEPGLMRELHWHPNANGWQHYLKGQDRMTVFNTGDEPLLSVETFRSDHDEEVSLASWLAHLPPSLVSQHLNIPEEVLATFPRGAQGIVPLRWSGPAHDGLSPRFSRPAG